MIGARAKLEAIQRHAHHQRLGKMLRLIERDGKRSKFVRKLGVLGNVCIDCPVRTECAAASVELADLETVSLSRAP